jgi:hypothetical protein
MNDVMSEPVYPPIRVTDHTDNPLPVDPRIMEVYVSLPSPPPKPLRPFIQGLIQSLEREAERIPYGPWSDDASRSCMI